MQFLSAYATSSAGLAQIDFVANGQAVGSTPAKGNEYNAVFSFKPDQPGDYKVQVIVKDATGATRGCPTK